MRWIFFNVVIPILSTFKLNDEAVSERTLKARLDSLGKLGVSGGGGVKTYGVALWAIISSA